MPILLSAPTDGVCRYQCLFFSLFPQMVYAAISGGQVVAQFWNFVENGRLTLKAADNLHRALLSSLLAAPMSFFHTNPIGR
jgi:ABC-type multidrug transport system fused ATPase/permease subunit